MTTITYIAVTVLMIDLGILILVATGPGGASAFGSAGVQRRDGVTS
jgi:hypothetical protein